MNLLIISILLVDLIIASDGYPTGKQTEEPRQEMREFFRQEVREMENKLRYELEQEIRSVKGM